MRTLHRKSIPARELIEPEDLELANAASLEELMTIVGRRAQERGLTEAKLQDILDEA